MADEAAQADAWTPHRREESGPPTCDRCGHAVSPTFYRVWNVNGELDGCRYCLPRSVRFSNAEVPDNPDDFDVEQFNR